MKNCSKCGAEIKNETFSKNTALWEYQNKAYWQNLCYSCTTYFEELLAKTNQDIFPKPADELVADKHYYIENDLFVFTEYYHLLRGNCCKSGCRHCAYGFNHQK